jgi:hypothetical protein
MQVVLLAATGAAAWLYLKIKDDQMVKIVKDDAHIDDGKYILEGGAKDAREIFLKQPYSHLKIKEMNVFDIGSSVGDSALYFLMRGAKRVYGYEADAKRHMMAVKNKEANQLANFHPCHKEIKDLSEIDASENSVLKMDIEGGEYQLFRSADQKDIRKFKEIILEFHQGDEPLVERLKSAGFTPYITHRSILNPKFGILYAWRE